MAGFGNTLFAVMNGDSARGVDYGYLPGRSPWIGVRQFFKDKRGSCPLPQGRKCLRSIAQLHKRLSRDSSNSWLTPRTKRPDSKHTRSDADTQLAGVGIPSNDRIGHPKSLSPNGSQFTLMPRDGFLDQ